MLHYAYGLDKIGKTLTEFPELEIYTKHYGHTSRDLGIYILKDYKLAGAAWIRLLRFEDTVPVLTMAIKPGFRSQGLGSMLLEQLLLEAAAKFEQISVTTLKDSNTIKFYKRFGFVEQQGSEETSAVNGQETIIMIKELEKKEVVRPTDGYDASKWMD